MEIKKHENPIQNPDSPEGQNIEQPNKQERDREIVQRYQRENEEREVVKYESNKEQVNLDPELQQKLAATEKQIEELTIRGRTKEAENLKQNMRKELRQTIDTYQQESKEVVAQLPMKALEAQKHPIQLDSKIDGGKFSKSFYESETLEVNERKVDANLLKIVSKEVGQNGKVYKLTEHGQKRDGTLEDDTYLIAEYSNDHKNQSDNKDKVYIGYATDHAGKYLQIFSIDTSTIDGKKYTVEEVTPATPDSETNPKPETHPHNIVNLEMGLEILDHDLNQNIDIESMTAEQVNEFNERLNKDWVEVHNLITTNLETGQRQKELFDELKDDLASNFLTEYGAIDPNILSPYSFTAEEHKADRERKQRIRDKLLEKIDTFAEYYKEDGELLKSLADQTVEQNLTPEKIYALVDKIENEASEQIKKLEHQQHLAEGGLINSYSLSKKVQDRDMTQEEADDRLFLHRNQAKQIAELEQGTWQPQRQRSE
jgi:hypothetical protein